MVKVFVERSRSRSGIHACRKFYEVLDVGCGRLSVQPKSVRSVKPLYSRGEAYEHEIIIPSGYFVIQAYFVRGLRSRVKGELLVFDSKGNLLCRAVYRKLKVRLISCSDDADKYLKIIKCVITPLKIPVKKYAILGKQRRRTN